MTDADDSSMGETVVLNIKIKGDYETQKNRGTIVIDHSRLPKLSFDIFLVTPNSGTK